VTDSADERDGQDSNDTRKELRDYLAKVNEELGKREEKVSVVEGEIAQLEFKLKELRSNRAISAGDISSVGSLESYRGHLKDQLARKKAVAKELNADVQRARDRREAVMKELSALNLEDGGESGNRGRQ
jgi:chromosome segregation ATPase